MVCIQVFTKIPLTSNTATIPDNTHDHRARIDICVDPQRPWFSFVLEEYNIVPYLIVALASQV